MRAIILLLLTAVISSCNNTKTEDSSLETVVYDGCEYVKSVYTYNALTHKGNCKFCISRNKK